MTIFERNSEQRKIPLVDSNLSASRGLLLALAGSVIMGAILLMDYLSPNNPNQFVYFIFVSLIPLILMIVALKVTTQANFKVLIQSKFWSKSNLKTWLVYFIDYAIFTQVAQTLIHLMGLKTNGHANIQNMTLSRLLINYGTDSVNLMNEELFSVFVFIGFAVVLQKQFKLSRSASIYGGLLISILLFGAIHYNGNLAQMFLLIGPARFFLTGAFIRSKNILIPFTMHYLFDQIGFTIIFLVEVLS